MSISSRSHCNSFDLKQESSNHQDTNVPINLKSNSLRSEPPKDSLTIADQNRDANVGALSTTKVAKFMFFNV